MLSPDEITHSLQAYPRKEQAPDGKTRAAVLLPLFLKHDAYHLLLTQRTEHVKDHKGQICFPGGACDLTDAGLQGTALRETEEEVGIRPEHIQLLGQLDDQVTFTGYHITPYVGIIPYPYTFQPRASEVARILEVPLAHVLDLANFRVVVRPFQNQEISVYFFQSGDNTVWGITGQILKNFLEVVFGFQCGAAGNPRQGLHV